MRTLVQFNYIISFVVILLGFVASYFSFKSQERLLELQERKQEQRAEQTHKSTPVKNETVVSEQHTDTATWRYECKLSLAGMEECSAYQTILWRESKAQAVEITLSMGQREGVPTPRLLLRTPLNVFLPPGVSLKLKTGEPFIVPFQYCAQDGCFVNLDLAPDVVNVMLEGGAAEISYASVDKQIAHISVSLDGFVQALSWISGNK